MPGHAIVYTDGACFRNGMYGAKAGYGIFWGENDPRNVSQPLAGEQQTNNRAELTAVIEAIKQAISDRCRRLKVRTDSEITVNMINEGWIEQWRARDWRKVKNADLVRQFDKLSKRIYLTMEHVPRNSNYGIWCADQLAKMGAECH